MPDEGANARRRSRAAPPVRSVVRTHGMRNEMELISNLASKHPS
jgi:hypothetical protein